MERRYCNRVLANVKLIIYQGGLPVAIARVTDASKAGLFIETEFTDVKLNQSLDIELPLRLEHGLCHFRFPARIVRRTSNGLALRVEGEHEQARKALFLLVEKYALANPTPMQLIANG